jgi:hypothetical protein
VKLEQESTSSNRDLEGLREAKTFRWFEETENWDDLCPAQEEANKEDMAERHANLYSSSESCVLFSLWEFFC